MIAIFGYVVEICHSLLTVNFGYIHLTIEMLFKVKFLDIYDDLHYMDAGFSPSALWWFGSL